MRSRQLAKTARGRVILFHMPTNRHAAGTSGSVGGRFREGPRPADVPSSVPLTLEEPSEPSEPQQPKRGVFRSIKDRYDNASAAAQVALFTPVFPAITATIGGGFVGLGGVEPGAALANASVLQGAAAGSLIGAGLSALMVVFSIPAISEDNQRRRSTARKALEASGVSTYNAYVRTDRAPQGHLKRIIADHPTEQDD